jgi:hypothetical protein
LLALAGTIADYNKYFVLTANINMGGQVSTTAIIAANTHSRSGSGFQGTAFTGVFDGKGHKIKNFTINGGNNDYLGLFGWINSGGSVKNLSLENFTVSGFQDVGGLVGYNYGTISNCYSTGTVSGIDGSAYTGGLAGYNYGTISNCYSTGTVSGIDGSAYTGGLAGYNYGTISNCYSTGTVSGGSNSTALGGLVGFNYNSISNCYSTGTVSGIDGSAYIGGLVGDSYGTISDCYSTGSVSGSSSVGGLVGYNFDSSISQCYSTGTVSGSNDVGGLVGANDYGSIIDCYSTGSVSGTSDIGGLVGYNDSDSIFSSYFLLGAGPDNGYGQLLTDEQMKQRASFAGWDFVSETTNGTKDDWRMCTDGVNYPLLWWQFNKADFACPDGIDFIDFAILANAWLSEPTQARWNPRCDIAEPPENVIDTLDLAIFIENWVGDSRFWLPKPLFEYPHKNSDITTHRDSRIIDSNNVTLAANTTRKQLVTSVGAIVPKIPAMHAIPWFVDHKNYSSDAIICENADNQAIWEYTTNLTNFTTICDFNNTKGVGDTNTMYSYGVVKHAMIADANWYVSMGKSDTNYEAGEYTGILFKSTDKGVTWNEILKTRRGILFFNIVGNNMVAGKYHSDTNDTEYGRDIYYSTDGGDTFVRIYNYEIYTGDTPNHFHMGYPLDTNTVYVAYGDEECAKVWKLTRPANWDGASNWTKTELARIYSCPWLGRMGNYIYCTRDGTKMDAWGDCLKINITDDSLSGTVHLPAPTTDNPYSPYNYSNSPRSTYGLWDDNGVMYMTFMNFSSVCTESGIIASADGNNWTYLYRDPTIYGINLLVGVANINETRYLIGAYVINSDVNSNRILALPISDVRTNTAVCVQKGFANNLARMTADGGTSRDQWYEFDSYSWDGNSYLDDGIVGYGMKYVAEANRGNGGEYRGIIYFANGFAFTDHYPSTGDYITLAFDSCSTPLFSSANYDILPYNYWDIIPSGRLFCDTNDVRFMPIPSDWEPYTYYNKCADSSNRASSIIFQTRSTNDVYRDGLSTVFDRLVLIYSPDRWFENVAPLMSKITNGVIDPNIVADEYQTIILSGVGTAWTLVFDWYPMSGYKSYPYSDSFPTLPIISVKSSSTFIDLDWDRQNLEFKLTDDEGTVSLSPTNQINWRHLDCVKVAIACDGTDSTLYIWHPENFAVNSVTDNNGILNVEADGIGLKMESPTLFQIGIDHSGSNIGAGCYTNIRVFDSVLTGDDIKTVFGKNGSLSE